MTTLLTRLSDLLFPPTPEAIVLREAESNQISHHYHPRQTLDTWYLCDYKTKLVQAAIKAHKFQHHPTAKHLLAALLQHWVTTQTEQLYFVPIPLSRTRERQRGHNQVTSILRVVTPSLTICPVLQRTINTKPQTQVDKSTRLTNIAGAFSVTHHIHKIPEHTTVVLVDDVLSTGATMKAARATLAPHLPSTCRLICLAIAH